MIPKSLSTDPQLRTYIIRHQQVNNYSEKKQNLFYVQTTEWTVAESSDIYDAVLEKVI